MVLQRLRSRDASAPGQALLEFALVLPILLLLFGGIVQIGTLIATNHSLNQIGRDVGRWAATQDADPCADLVDDAQPYTRAHELAVESRLMGYRGEWADPANFTPHVTLPPTPPTGAAVEVAWEISGPCPPEDSTTASFVTIRLTHEAPVLLPGFAYLPGIGNNGVLLISTTAKFRMEPQAEPAPSGP